MKPSDDPRLSAYLDEMLSGKEMVRVKQMLTTEPEAQAEIARLEQTRAVLRQLGDPSPPPDFWPQTRQRLRAYALQQEEATSNFRDRIRRLVKGTFLALLCSGLCVALVHSV